MSDTWLLDLLPWIGAALWCLIIAIWVGEAQRRRRQACVLDYGRTNGWGEPLPMGDEQ